jgi:hypothetical protein
MTAREALRSHWPEYLIEGWALGTFMISAGIVATPLRDGSLGWSAGVITHDPDGHASLIARDHNVAPK